MLDNGGSVVPVLALDSTRGSLGTAPLPGGMTPPSISECHSDMLSTLWPLRSLLRTSSHSPGFQGFHQRGCLRVNHIASSFECFARRVDFVNDSPLDRHLSGAPVFAGCSSSSPVIVLRGAPWSVISYFSLDTRAIVSCGHCVYAWKRRNVICAPFANSKDRYCLRAELS